jgi:hypothetical protein
MAQPNQSHNQQTVQEQRIISELLAEWQAIEERRQYALRFHALMNQHGHLERPVQYERLFRHAPEGKEEKTHAHRSGTPKSHRRRVPQQRVGRHGHRRGEREQRVLFMDAQR